MKTARLPATLAKYLTLALTLLFLGSASGLHASPADPKRPISGPAVQPPKSVQAPLAGIYSATVTVDDTPGHLLGYGGKPNNNCSPAPAGHYLYYYPGPGRSGALWVLEDPYPRSGQGRTYVAWDPNFLNPPFTGVATGVTLWHPSEKLFPWDPQAVAWLPPNNADPALFQPLPYGYRGSDITTTFDTPTHFTLAGIWGWNTENCYETADLVRIGCAGNHTTDWGVWPGSDGRIECQRYCELIPDGPAAGPGDGTGYWKCGYDSGPVGLPTVVRAADPNQPGTLTVCPCIVQVPSHQGR